MILTLNIPQTGVTTQATTGSGFNFGLSTSARASKASKDVVLSGRPLGIFAGVAAYMVSAANGKARGHRALFDAFAAGNKKAFDKAWPTWVSTYTALLKAAAAKFKKDGKGGFIKQAAKDGMSQSAVFNPNSLNAMMTDVLRSMDTTATETFPMYSYSDGEDMEMDIATASSLWFVFNAAAIKGVADTSKSQPPEGQIPTLMYNDKFSDIEKLLAKAGTTVWNRASAGKMNNDKGMKADGTPQSTTRTMSDAARKRATDKAFETRNANRVAKGLQPLVRRAPKVKKEDAPTAETKPETPTAAAGNKPAGNKPPSRKPAGNKAPTAETKPAAPAANTPPARKNRAGAGAGRRPVVQGDLLA